MNNICIHPVQHSYQAYHDIRIQVSRSDKQSNPTYIKLITFVSILFNICIKPIMTFHPFQHSYQAYHDIRIQVSRSAKQSNPTYIKLITFVSILFNIHP